MDFDDLFDTQQPAINSPLSKPGYPASDGRSNNADFEERQLARWLNDLARSPERHLNQITTPSYSNDQTIPNLPEMYPNWDFQLPPVPLVTSINPPSSTTTTQFQAPVVCTSAMPSTSTGPVGYCVVVRTTEMDFETKTKEKYEEVKQKFIGGERRCRSVPCPTCRGCGVLKNFKCLLGREEGDVWEKALDEEQLLDQYAKMTINVTGRNQTPNYVKRELVAGTKGETPGHRMGKVRKSELSGVLRKKLKQKKTPRGAVAVGAHLKGIERNTKLNRLLLEPALEILTRLTDKKDHWDFGLEERYRLLYKLQYGEAPAERGNFAK